MTQDISHLAFPTRLMTEENEVWTPNDFILTLMEAVFRMQGVIEMVAELYYLARSMWNLTLQPLFWFQAFHQILDLAAGICSHSETRALASSNIDVGWGLAHSRCSSLTQRCWMALRSGLCAGQSVSTTRDWENHFFEELAGGALLCWNKAKHKLLEEHYCLKYHCVLKQ